MKQLLYIGNNLKRKRSNHSFMSTLGPLLASEGYQVRYASSKPNKIFRLLDMLFTVIRYRSTTDIVLIDTYSTQNFWYAFSVSQLCRLLKLKYVPILHGGHLAQRLKKSKGMSQRLFRNALTNVAPSLFLKKAFEASGFQNITYIPNVIEISNYPFLKRSFDTPNVLWVRSFSKIYNPSMAVRVLKSLQDKGIKATLCMVGPDADGTLQEVQQLAHQLEVEVTFTDKLSKQEWIQLSEYYNVFINTTNVDNTPVSVIEAMALGLPIVSTNVGGMPYLITHKTHGLLVEADAVEAMAHAIIQVFENPEQREHMIANARQLAETFDWEKVKTAWREVLDV